MRDSGGGGSPLVGIDPAGLAVLIRAMSAAQTEMYAAANSLQSSLRNVGVVVYGPTPLTAVAAWFGSQVPSLQRRQALAEAAGQLQPWTRTAGNMVWLDEALVTRFATPADALAAGKAAAVRLRASLDNGEIDPQVAADLELLKADPHFALGFAQDMGPQGLTDLPLRLVAMREELERNAAYLGPDFVGERDALIAQSVALMTAVGNTFAAATRGNTPDTALPASFVEDLVKGLPHNGFGLSQLLRFGDHSTEFLGTISEGLYTHEREEAYGKGYWQGIASGNGSYATPSIGPSNGQDDQGFFDPMVGLMTAMSRNPVAAQNLLSDPAKLEYFSSGRVWTSDQGNAYGKTLEAATTTFRDHTEPPGSSAGYTSAMIASQVIRTIGDKADGRIYEGMRDSVGNILAAYISDVDKAAIDARTDDPGVDGLRNPDMPDPQPYGAIFRRADLSKVMTQAFEDHEAFKTVSAAATAYSNTFFEEIAKKVVAQAGPGLAQTGALGLDAGSRDRLETAAQHAASMFGLITQSGNIANIALADSEDARAKIWLDLANSGLDLVPLPGKGFAEKALGFAVGQTKDQVFDHFAPSSGAGARVTAGTANDVTQTMLVDMAAAAMAKHGVFGTSATSPAGLHAPGSEYRFVMPDGTLVSWKTMTPLQRTAYRGWITSSDAGVASIRTAIEAAFD